MRLLYQSVSTKIELAEPWLFVDGKKFGFTMTSDEGDRILVVHSRKIQQFNREKGFYIPAPLLSLRMIFEVKLKEDKNGKPRYGHWLYRPDQKHRLMSSKPEVFISLARLEFTDNAEHYRRPPIYEPR